MTNLRTVTATDKALLALSFSNAGIKSLGVLSLAIDAAIRDRPNYYV